MQEPFDGLRRKLDELARDADDDLYARYTLPRPPLPKGFYWRLRWLAARALHGLERLRVLPSYPWPPALRHAPGSRRTKPFLIWAVGTDRETLRRACEGFAKRPVEGFAPVLVTDVADFAFFSRLGWLVEYVPKLSPPAAGFADRKVRYLASRYRGAAALPWSIGLVPDVTAERVLALIGARSDDPARANG